MTKTTERTADRLREGFEGAVILPGEADYDEARKVFNGAIDRRPAVIAQCASVADVQKAIRYGHDAELEIAVRGGGHGVAGRALSEGGLVVDLRRMSVVTVDPGGASRASLAVPR